MNPVALLRPSWKKVQMRRTGDQCILMTLKLLAYLRTGDPCIQKMQLTKVCWRRIAESQCRWRMLTGESKKNLMKTRTSRTKTTIQQMRNLTECFGVMLESCFELHYMKAWGVHK